MFKKNLLAVAVLAMTSSVALADNEAYISQGDDTGTASVATVEQIYNDVATAHYGVIIQNVTDTSNSMVYQGLSDSAGTVGTVDPTAPTLTTPLATTIDPTVAAFVDIAGTPYEPLTAAVTNFALIKQDGAANAFATVLQVTGDEIADLDNANDNFANAGALIVLADPISGNNIGIDAGVLTDGFVEIEPGAVSGTTDANTGNIAVIAQGAGDMLDRAGNALGLGAQGDASDGELALIVQMGTGNMAQILQTGDAQLAAIIQDNESNDAYIAQYAGTGNTAVITQTALADIATIYQSGDANTARIYQHEAQ